MLLLVDDVCNDYLCVVWNREMLIRRSNNNNNNESDLFVLTSPPNLNNTRVYRYLLLVIVPTVTVIYCLLARLLGYVQYLKRLLVGRRETFFRTTCSNQRR